MRVAVSITAHEEPAVIIDQCLNILNFLADPLIVMHVNKDSESVYQELIFWVGNLRPDVASRIHITADRFSTGKDSFSLHKAHGSNLRALRDSGVGFDYFMLEASNSLFVRYGVEDYIKRFDAGIGKGKVAGFWRESILRHRSLESFGALALGEEFDIRTDGVMKGCHEGAFFSEKFVDDVFHAVGELDEYCSLSSDPPLYPTEEVWYQLAIKIVSRNAPGFVLGNTVTYLPWDRSLEWDRSEIDVFIDDCSVGKDKYAIKRIPREFSESARSYIANKFGYRLPCSRFD
ncbi:hypothetical protein [Microbulbifer hydrolyticus]|uniref:Glycosyl transferase n=1 Tax=Microbulbifer hydrolyticus TaxID=48074 RepID=A0A6P1TE66_9GAMM|nr:hypothetical protein [Microbulbifer hydrolyticus]MBB5212308.1 hypothetical protein [Microbulbifer hydrolyticus]QHQ39955.1 hypothetical protein GTQ55_13820 [Microbulbifer hydrolyticus]